MNPIHCNRILSRSAATVLLAASAFGIAHAAEIATDPGDYQALPAGTSAGVLYIQHTEHDTLRSDGKTVPVDAKLRTDIGLARYIHFMEIGGFIADPQVIIPFGQVDLDVAGTSASASGVGDPLVGGTLWLVNRPEQKQWFGVSAFVSLPLGDYDNDRAVNIGRNRWKTILQAGYVTGLGDKFMLDLLAETAFYGDNDEAGASKATLSQAQSYGLQAHLRYLISPTSHVALSYYHDFGGETELNGVSQNDEMNNNRWLLTFATFVAPTIQLQLQAGQSIHVENGFEEAPRVNLRLLKVF